VGALAQGGDGAIWIGTDSEGVWRGTKEGFVGIGLQRPEAVNALLPTGENAMWVGTSSGLERCDRSGCTSLDILEGAGVRSLLLDDADGVATLWVGTNGHGVWQLRGLEAGPHVHGVPITREQGLPNNVGLAMTRFAGDLWIGSGRGLVRLKDDRLVVYGEGNGFPVSMVFGLQPAPGPDGRQTLYASLRPGG